MPWIDSNGVSLRYELSGEGSRLLVLLHEMGGCLESWDRVLPQFASSFRLLRFDMRGSGLSEKRPGAFTMDDLADDLAGLLDALELTQPVALAGCAVGAALALRFAARWPDRCLGVLAMAPATGITLAKKPDTMRLAIQIEAQGVRPRVTQRFDHSYPAHYFDDAAQRAQLRGRLLSNDPHAYAASYRMLCELDMQADFAKIQCPVLLIAGRHDPTRPPDMVQKLASAIRQAKFVVIDSGHAMPILSPARVAREIIDFLGSLTHK